MGNPRAVNALRRWCDSLAPDIVFLSETKINKLVAENLKISLGFSNSFGVSSVGLSGGLCIFWNNDNVSFTLVSYSQHHICGDVTHVSGRSWRFIGVYG